MRCLLCTGSLTAAVIAAFAALLTSYVAPAAAGADGKPALLKVEEAEMLVRDYVFAENPKMNPQAAFPVTEVTPKTVRERLGAQVFVVVDGVQLYETFVICEKKVYRIGKAFGGPGVTSMVTADPGGDGRDKLIFAYAWGSGEHRSQVGVLDVLAKMPSQAAAPLAYFGDLGDLTVKNGERGAVEIQAAAKKSAG